MSRTISELWKYRALIWALIGRHLGARYRGSALGFVWSFLNPLCLIAVYSLVFRHYIRFEGVEHYTAFLFVGLLPWLWVSGGLLEATAAISSGGNLITKAMFPPQILPVVSILTNLIHFLLAIPLLLGFLLLTGVPLGAGLLLFPLVVAIQLVFLTGLSLALSALNVHYRDVQHVLANFLTLWFFLCPIVYPVTTVPERFRFTLYLNPVALFTEMYQSMFLEGVLPPLAAVGCTLLFALVSFAVGNFIFSRYREDFAELV